MFYFTRVLLTCIKFLGNFPCPWCSIHKQQIQELGTVRDSKRRGGKHVQTNNNKRQATVNAARRLIYVNGLSVNSAAVEERLADKSLTPTRVCC